MSWTIQGEAGKALDETPRDYLEIGSGWQAQIGRGAGIDSLSWSQATVEIDGAGELAPEDGQEVSLWLGGVCHFRGVVEEPTFDADAGFQGRFQAHGAGWWLDRVTLSALITDATDEQIERPNFTFPQASIKTNIESLLSRAATLGIPVQAGTIDPTLFTMALQTMSNVTFLQALVELLKCCPDAFAWWDYDLNPPALNVSRRGTAAVLSLDLDDPASIVEAVQLRKRSALKAAAVSVHFAEKLPGGGTILNEDDSEKIRASLVTAMTGANNDMVVTARRQGAAGNAITIAISATTRPDIEVERAGNAVTVFRRTGGNTAQDVVDAINTAVAAPAYYSTANYRIVAAEPGDEGNGVQLQITGSGQRSVSVTGKKVVVGGLAPVAGLELESLLAAFTPAARLMALEVTSGNPFLSTGTYTLANASASPSALIQAGLAPGNDGTGAVTTLAATNLAGGSDGPAVPVGQRARVVVSGPELDTFLPIETPEFVRVRTGDLSGAAVFYEKEARIIDLVRRLGTFTIIPDDYRIHNPGATGYIGIDPFTRLAGTSVNLAPPSYLKTAETPEWLNEMGPYFVPIEKGGTWLYREVAPNYASLSQLGKDLHDAADFKRFWIHPSYFPPGTYVMDACFNLSASVVGTDLPTNLSKIFFKPDEFGFQRPPEDLAANLKAAQDWTPYDGNVKLVDIECDPGPLLGRVVNIVGGRPEWAAMKAVPNGIDCDLQSGRATILLGAPPAFGTVNLARRVSGNPKDNLVI